MKTVYIPFPGLALSLFSSFVYTSFLFRFVELKLFVSAPVLGFSWCNVLFKALLLLISIAEVLQSWPVHYEYLIYGLAFHFLVSEK
jgi:hypothetical protein